MTIGARLACIAVLALIGAGATSIRAMEMNCGAVTAMAKVAAARNDKALESGAKQLNESYLARTVSAARRFELHGDRRSATLLLNLLPASEEQQIAWGSLGESMCDRETVAEMKVLGGLSDRLAHNIARAVVLVPERMMPYVTFSLMTTSDPHSEYSTEMQRVCLRRKKELAAAVEKLPADKKQWFTTHVMNLASCQALSLPEAE